MGEEEEGEEEDEGKEHVRNVQGENGKETRGGREENEKGRDDIKENCVARLFYFKRWNC